MKIIFVLVVLMGVTGSLMVTINPETASVDKSPHPSSAPETAEETGQIKVLVEEGAVEDVMETGELNPSHYPAQRAAKVVQHYLNTRYGSPYKLIQLQRVHSGKAEDVEDSGRKYQLEISVNEILSNTKQKCSAELFFPRGEEQHPPQVQALCEELLKIDTKAQEAALYQQYKTNPRLVSAQNLPDSHGHIEPDMKPLWHLGIVASSFVMLNKSTENSLYNIAQVANITQLATENDQLKFDCHTLLHEMVSQAYKSLATYSQFNGWVDDISLSVLNCTAAYNLPIAIVAARDIQEIIHWKLLFTWSPAEGVKVLQMEQLPHQHDWEKPLNTY